MALGRTDDTSGAGQLSGAISAGFAMAEMPARFGSEAGIERHGAALLRALAGFTSGAAGRVEDVRDGLALLRMLGFETAARRTALELLILTDPA